MRWVLPTLGLVVLLAPRALDAQRLAQLPSPWYAHAPLEADRDRPAPIRSGDYRVEGAVLGGVLLGAAGVLIGAFGCADPGINGSPRSCGGAEVGAGALGFLAGAAVGYLVGRSVPKDSKE